MSTTENKRAGSSETLRACVYRLFGRNDAVYYFCRHDHGRMPRVLLTIVSLVGELDKELNDFLRVWATHTTHPRASDFFYYDKKWPPLDAGPILDKDAECYTTLVELAVFIEAVHTSRFAHIL